MRIWKFPLQITDEQLVEMPVLARPLSVAEQDGQLVMWVHLNEKSNEKRHYKIRIIGTGNPMPDSVGNFIGTVVMSYGLVWHVFYQ
jgi:hypothetical protein